MEWIGPGSAGGFRRTLQSQPEPQPESQPESQPEPQPEPTQPRSVGAGRAIAQARPLRDWARMAVSP
jgi:hypothetical protein